MLKINNVIQDLQDLLDELYNSSFDENDVFFDFEKCEQRIGKILEDTLNTKNISIKLTSEDETELYDGDWTYPVSVEVEENGKDLGFFYGYDKKDIKGFINHYRKNKKRIPYTTIDIKRNKNRLIRRRIVTYIINFRNKILNKLFGTYPDKFIIEYQNSCDWGSISSYHKLSNNFLKNWESKVDWSTMDHYQKSPKI